MIKNNTNLTPEEEICQIVGNVFFNNGLNTDKRTTEVVRLLLLATSKDPLIQDINKHNLSHLFQDPEFHNEFKKTLTKIASSSNEDELNYWKACVNHYFSAIILEIATKSSIKSVKNSLQTKNTQKKI